MCDLETYTSTRYKKCFNGYMNEHIMKSKSEVNCKHILHPAAHYIRDTCK